MKFNLTQSTRLEQNINVRMLKSLKMLAMPSQKLDVSLRQAAELNPAIELIDPRIKNVDFDKYENFYTNENNNNNPELEKQKMFFLNSITENKTLINDLEEQLHELSDLNEDEQYICEELIGNVNEDGFLELDLNELCEKDNFEIDEILELLDLLQMNFEPAGVLARNLKECLSIQLKRLPIRNKLAEKLCKNHLQELDDPNNLANILHVDLKEITQAINVLKSLNTRPGSIFDVVNNNEIIHVDFIFFKNKKGIWQSLVNDVSFPKVQISEDFKIMGKSINKSDEESKTFVKESINQAKLLQYSLENRMDFLEKFGNKLMEKQIEFLEHGIGSLNPLTMRELGEELGVHTTTICRAASNKYAKTPWGNFSIRDFFCNGFKTDEDKHISNTAIKQRIKRLIELEDKHKPLSDQAISDYLKNEGLNIARRTIAKYRDALKISNTSKRKIRDDSEKK